MSEQQENQPQNNPVDVAAIEARLRSELEAEKAKILANRDQILEEKRQLEQRFKGFDEDKYAKFQEFQQRVEKDEMLKLASEGQFDEITAKLMSGQINAWKEKENEWDERLTNAQKHAEEKEQESKALHDKLLATLKKQYLKDITISDDSFKKENFAEFAELYASRVEIDEETGAAFALDNGKRMFDTEGNPVLFNDFYAKQKVKSGLFWNGGSGSGYKGGQGGQSVLDIGSMSPADSAALRKEIGDDEYIKLVRNKK